MSVGPQYTLLQPDAGCSDFKTLRQDHGYYVDKTAHLPRLLQGHGPLLITRPRRFGKTLTLDTLRRFLELDYQNPGDTTAQQQLFAGLAILEDSQYQACRERCMGRHPVVALSFNTVEGSNYAEALKILREQISALYTALAPPLQSPERLMSRDLRMIERCLNLDEEQDPAELKTTLISALLRLCQMLYRIYSRPVYILIDEYDTPLARAWSRERSARSAEQVAEGYYSRMADLMRGLLHPLLKPQPAAQDSIARCICTGCTRVSRESFFSGANNLSVLGLNDPSTATLMGFTAQEVQAMLHYYALEARLAAVKRWYNGYKFAGVQIYNPWSIASYCKSVLRIPALKPCSYWAHSSGNDLLTQCLYALHEQGLSQLQLLCEGKKVVLPIR